MRHNTAVRVDLGERGQGWHYANVGSRGGGPIGHCAEHPPHATEAEARACYRQYQRDRITFDGRSSNWMGCEARVEGKACDKPTKSFARSGGWLEAGLCDDHLTREHAIVALGLEGDQVGDSWES